MGPDPHVIGIIPGDRSQYGGPLYALPDHDLGERPRYAHDDLWRFKLGSDEKAHFDNALVSRTKVLVRDGPIQSHLVTKETSAGHVPLVSLQVRAGRTAGNSRDHSLIQPPECGNEFNQAWESCTTTG